EHQNAGIRAVPLWLQQLFVSAQGLQFRLRRQSTRLTREYWQFLLKTQRWSSDQFLDFQLQGLREVLTHAFATVPHYQRIRHVLDCAPEDFKNLDDFRKLPITE